jgi:hypothetical protein
MYFNSAQKMVFGLATSVRVTTNISCCYPLIFCHVPPSIRLSTCISASPKGQISV